MHCIEDNTKTNISRNLVGGRTVDVWDGGNGLQPLSAGKVGVEEERWYPASFPLSVILDCKHVSSVVARLLMNRIFLPNYLPRKG